MSIQSELFMDCQNQEGTTLLGNQILRIAKHKTPKSRINLQILKEICICTKF